MDATALNVYVGYDPRIETAVNVCVSSLQRRSTVPVHLLQKSSLDRKSTRLNSSH